MEKNTLSGIVSDFVGDYFSEERDPDNMQDWLSDEMTKHLPEMSSDEAQSTSGTIIATVKRVNDCIASAQNAAKENVSAEKWFNTEFNERTDGLTVAEKGKVLTQMYNGFCGANSDELMQEMPDDAWDNFSLLQMASDVVKKAGAVALRSAVTSVDESIERSMEEGTELVGADVIGSAINSAADMGLKCAAAGATRIAQKKGWLETVLPEDTSTEEITSMAVGAVEDIKVCFKAATGEITALEAADQVQRNVVARAVDYVADHADKIGKAIGTFFNPLFGGEIGEKIGKGIKYLCTTEVKDFIKVGVNKVCTAARNLFTGAVNKLKNGVKEFFSLFS